MKAIFYYVMRAYTSLSLVFYYKNILVSGKKNIAKNKAIVFISNHPNALIDPLLVSYSDLRPIHYLTQAAAFSGSFVNIILEALNMIPVYRVRDGIGKEKLISLNEQTFRHCHDILNNRGIILIYVEGSHNVRRKVRPFRKGFARIVFGAMDKYNDLEIDIIPVGMNYTEVDAYASKVSINYGKPIAVRPFWKNKDRNEAISELLKVSSEQLKLVTNHIDDLDNYDKIINHFDKDEFLSPEKVN
ncbi:MAG: 1-acyl-sn-glycerol-3-phosphate acyltransferase, partial [Flavobacteriaceae bacterium]|nr:1-acyl-sn-glycerol-3-phosphate acyltransferase [Flavobacteriaceae bacterium]